MGITRKLQELGKDKFYINLPVSIVKLKNWKKGDIIRMDITDKGDLIIRK